jgi:hypothetical protein
MSDNQFRVRQVKQNKQTGMWAFLEFNAADPTQFIIMGGMEFTHEAEAREYARGFAPDSYTYVNPMNVHLDALKMMEKSLSKQLESVRAEIKTVEDILNPVPDEPDVCECGHKKEDHRTVTITTIPPKLESDICVVSTCPCMKYKPQKSESKDALLTILFMVLMASPGIYNLIDDIKMIL